MCFVFFKIFAKSLGYYFFFLMTQVIQKAMLV